MTGRPLRVPQDRAPCELHADHRPVTIVNELHHPFPQEWQRQLWGQVRDNRLVALCATGHNNVHAAIDHFERYGTYPSWCIGKTRDLAETAFARLEEAKADVDD